MAVDEQYAQVLRELTKAQEALRLILAELRPVEKVLEAQVITTRNRIAAAKGLRRAHELALQALGNAGVAPCDGGKRG